MILALLQSLAFGVAPTTCDLPGHSVYTVEATLDRRLDLLSVTLTIKLTNQTDSDWPEVVLRMPEVPAHMEMIRVWNGDAVVLSTTRDTALHLKIPVAADTSRTFTIAYVLDLPKHMTPVSEPTAFGWVDQQLLLADWLPMVVPFRDGAFQVRPAASHGDHAFFEPADFAVTLHASGFDLAVATGDVSSMTPMADPTSFRFEAKGVREFAAALCEGCQNQRVTGEGYQLSITAPGVPSPAAVVAAQHAMGWMFERVGPLSAWELDIVFVPGESWGVEYPGLVFVAAPPSAWKPIDSFLLGHEMAHQWWYAEVGNDQWTEPWVDEGLAEWMTFAWLKEWDEPQYTELFDAWSMYSDTYTARPPTGTVRDYDGDYAPNVYFRPAVFWDSVAKEDPGAFRRALRRYYEQERCGFATHNTLASIVAKEQTAPGAGVGALYDALVTCSDVSSCTGQVAGSPPTLVP